MFTDGSRLEDGAAGYAVAWKNVLTWKGIKTHMGYNREAFDAECAALARALESASRRNTIPDRITIFTDAQAAIRRMASDEPGPGQKYALQARKYIAKLRRAVPGITIEIRWCPAHDGVQGNEKADEWAKLAAEEPDTNGVEWLSFSDREGARAMPLPRSLAHLKREITEKKWEEAREWAGSRTSRQKYRMPKGLRPDALVADSQEACLKGLPAEIGTRAHWAVPALDQSQVLRTVLVVPEPEADEEPPLQGVSEVEGAAEDSVGGGEEGNGDVEESVEEPGSDGQRKVQPGGTRLSLHHGCGKAGAT